MSITAEEVRLLKAQWCADPCWDIETTQGFEHLHDHLLAYRLRMEDKWKEEHDRRVKAKAASLHCSPELAEYIMELEQKLERIDRYLLEH